MEQIIDNAVQCLMENGSLDKSCMIVLGCSTSEVAGGMIGKASVPDLGKRIAQAFFTSCQSRGLIPVYQCCEHLNRALVMDKTQALSRGLTIVKAVPKPKAGGSVAAAAWLLMDSPVLVQSVLADAAIDIGDTLVGMHIRPVAVPVRMADNKVGNANLVMAYSRFPLIGGERAQYE